MSEASIGGFDPGLGQAFVFTAQDLEANRRGHLSPDQEALWRNTIRARTRGAARGVRLIVLALAGAAILAVAIGSRTPGTGRGSWILVAVMLGVIGAIAGLFIGRGRRGTAALAATALRVAEGEFHWSSDLSENWWGEVGDARFGIDRLAQSRLTDGARYRVYWLPLEGTAWVQSIERI